MKIKSTIAAISAASAIIASSAYADDINTVVSIDSVDNGAQAIGRFRDVYRVNIQDYVDEANQNVATEKNTVAENVSRWHVEGAL